MAEISKIAEKALSKTRDDLTKTYRELLIGKEIYKTSETKATFIGTITDVCVDRFTQYDGIVLTISTADRSFNVFGCNLHSEDRQYGWFYKSTEVI